MTKITLLRITIVLATLTAALLMEFSPTGTGEYPAKPITLVIPFAPGGESDFFGRELQKAIRDHKLLIAGYRGPERQGSRGHDRQWARTAGGQ